MHFLYYLFMCVYIGLYLHFTSSGTPVPPYFRQLNHWVSWGFLTLGGLLALWVIIDCLLASSRGEMTAENVRSGILLALLHFLPLGLMTAFMLREGFAGK